MEKIIKVNRTAQGKNYVEQISLQGNYLKKNGFDMGEYIKVKISKGKITITSDEGTKLLTKLGHKNPHILSAIAQNNL